MAEDSANQVKQLAAIAEDLDVSTAQLALAWTASNPHVSTVILGASSAGQLNENLGALHALEHLTPELKATIDEIFEN